MLYVYSQLLIFLLLCMGGKKQTTTEKQLESATEIFSERSSYAQSAIYIENTGNINWAGKEIEMVKVESCILNTGDVKLM